MFDETIIVLLLQLHFEIAIRKIAVHTSHTDEECSIGLDQCWAKSLANQIRIDSNHDLPIK